MSGQFTKSTQDTHRPQIRDRRWDKRLPNRCMMQRFGSQCKSTYCFCAHMHEITKYFLFTENQKQMSESVLSHPCRAGVYAVVLASILALDQCNLTAPVPRQLLAPAHGHHHGENQHEWEGLYWPAAKEAVPIALFHSFLPIGVVRELQVYKAVHPCRAGVLLHCTVATS